MRGGGSTPALIEPGYEARGEAKGRIIGSE